MVTEIDLYISLTLHGLKSELPDCPSRLRTSAVLASVTAYSWVTG
jgi:hypothetical protein